MSQASLEVGSESWRAVMREAYLRALPVRDAGLLWVERGGRRTSARRLKAGLAEAAVSVHAQLQTIAEKHGESMALPAALAMALWQRASAEGDLKTAASMVRELREMATVQKKGAFLDLNILNLPPGSNISQPALADMPAGHLPSIQHIENQTCDINKPSLTVECQAARV